MYEGRALPAVMLAALYLSLPNLIPTFWPRFNHGYAENFWSSFGLILLPCIISVSVRTTLYLWAPAAALVPGALIYIFITGSPIREWTFVILMETDWNELSRFWVPVAIGTALAPLFLIFYCRLIRRFVPAGHRLLWPSRIVVLLLASIIPLRQLARSGPEFGAMIIKRKSAAIFPSGLPVSLWNAWRIRQQFSERGRIAEDLQVQSTSPATREIHILVVGESARFSSFQINGAPRETTPLLAKKTGLINFRNVAAPATVTLMSVPVLLTPATSVNLLDAPSLPSIITACRRAGFYTAWYSTQMKHGAFDTACSIFSRDAHESRFLSGSFAPGVGTYASALDGELIQPVRDLIAKGEPKLFIVLHTMGSHQHYADRFPPELDRFSSHGARVHGDFFPAKFSAQEARNLSNAYDNTILYTDWVLSELIDTLARTKALASLYYISDHGQNTGDAKVMPFGHGTMTRDVVHVPCFVWLSPEFRQKRSSQTAALEAHADAPLSASSTFHTLLQIAGLECQWLNPHRSAASDSFSPGKRLVRDMEGVIHDFDEVLKPQK